MDVSARIDAEFFRHEYETFNTALKGSQSSFLLGEVYALSSGPAFSQSIPAARTLLDTRERRK
jgi:hypothetical protein